MTSTSCPALYKKIAGILSVESHQAVWTPATQAPSVRIDVSAITNLQATPATSSKLLLKVMLAGGQVHVFGFTERASLDKIKLALQSMVQGHREKGLQRQSVDSEETDNLSPSHLINNLKLQQALLKENKHLFKPFQQTVIQGSLANEEFWAARVQDLRTFAIASAQTRGPYNVLSTVRPTSGADNQLNVSLTRDKIKDIFAQYPLVRQAYNECVPQVSESDFWARFFMSRLFRHLRGEKILSSDATDPVLDKYIDNREHGIHSQSNVQPFLDIQGNEENNPQKLGVRPDVTMRQTSSKDALSLINSVNGVSFTMINLASTPVTTSTPHSTRKYDLNSELSLEGLESESSAPTRELHLSSRHVYSGASRSKTTRTTQTMPRNCFDEPLDLRAVVAANDNHHLAEADTQIVSSVARAASISVHGDVETNTESLDHVQVCHATTVEFLSHFWSYLLSGNTSKVSTLSKTAQGLNKSLQRIEAVIEQDTKDPVATRSLLNPVIHAVKFALKVYEQSKVASSTH